MSEVGIDNDLLISSIEARPVLWDKTLNIFKDRVATRNAWKQVCSEIRNDFDELEDEEKNEFGKEVLRRWKNLRDAYVKAEKKVGKASGSKATKKRKYIFHEELRFLSKVYTERETADSYNVDNGTDEEDITDDLMEVSTVNKEVDKTTASKSSPKTRKQKKLDLKILKALDAPQEQQNSQMSFFQSLLPHTQNFNENELLDFKMGVLQVISNIKSKRSTVPPNQTFPPPVHYQHHNQPTYYYPQHQSCPYPTSSSTPLT